jgi:hypothetical protein
MAIEFKLRNLSDIIATRRFDQTTVVIGTASDCDMVVSAEPEVAFQFCVELSDSGATVTCLHEVGVMINSSPVFEKGQTCPLKHGDVIRLVGNEYRFTFSYTSKSSTESADLPTSTQGDLVSAVEQTTEASLPNPAGSGIEQSEISTVTLGTAVGNIVQEHRYIIAMVCFTVAILALLVFTFQSTPSGNNEIVSDALPEVEIIVTVDEHQTMMIDLLDAVRNQRDCDKLTVEDITYSLVLNTAVTFDSDKGQIVFSPSEADAPKNFILHLDCLATLPKSSVPLQQPVIIRCEFIEVIDVPIVNPVRSIQLGLSDVRPIALVIDALDPDLPQDELTYKADKQLPDGATLDSATGSFQWVPTKSQYGENYLISITVLKNSRPELMSMVDFNIQLVDDSELNVNRKSYEDSLYVLWLKDPTNKFLQPIATTIAIAPGVLATNATTIKELQKHVFSDWSVWVGRIGQEDLVPVSDMLVHGYFPIGQMKYGEGSYRSIFFDVGIVQASEEFIQSFVDVIDSASYLKISASQDVDLMSINIADHIQDSTEVLSSSFTHGKIVSADPLSIVESSEVPDFVVLGVAGVFTEHVDGAPLLIDGKLFGLYSTPILTDDKNEESTHLFTVPICLSDYDDESKTDLWVPAPKAFPQVE